MNIMNELELYKHTNSVQAKEIERLKELNIKYRFELDKLSSFLVRLHDAAHDIYPIISTILKEKD